MVQTIGIINGEVDSTKAISETEEEIVIPAILAREGVLPYPKGKMYRSAEELKNCLFTFEKAWVTAEKHPEPLISIVTNRRDIKGDVSDITFDADAINPVGKKSAVVRGNVHIKKKNLSRKFLEDVKSLKKPDVSIGFLYDTINKPGEWQGEHYDFVQDNLLVNHIAVGVPVGRMRAPFIGLGCDAIDFEFEKTEADAFDKLGHSVSGADEVLPPANPSIPAKVEVTLPPTTESTGSLLDKLRRFAHL
jgi:hypothetical protein